MRRPISPLTGPGTPPPGVVAQDNRAEKVLVVDDSRAHRTLLCSLLRRWGHDVLSCDDAEAALRLLDDPEITLIISDWMMPGMTGPEFCRRFRALRRESYGYILLLTSKSDKDAIAHGLDAGADDFLTKPVNAHELKARIHAGARIVEMQRELVRQNRIVSATLSEIRGLYDALDRDLREAQKLQQSLLRETHRHFGPSSLSLLLRSSGHVGGDLVGYFPVSPGLIGLYSLDVSGHGVTSAMITARLAGMLSAASPDQNIAMVRGADGRHEALSPDIVAERLNTLMLEEVESDQYFTICLGLFDLSAGRFRFVQAGHPHPFVQAADGEIRAIGEGGLPVGLIAGAQFETQEILLSPGDRLLIHSDGMTECPGPDGGMLDEDGLAAILSRLADRRGPDCLSSLERALEEFAGTGDFPDDVSALLFEYEGPLSDR